MSATTAWFVSIMAFLGLFVALHQLGVNAGETIGAIFRSAEHLLVAPL